MKRLLMIALGVFLAVAVSSRSDAQTTTTETCSFAAIPVLQGDHVICSYTAAFSGPCNGSDLYNQWTVSSSPQSDRTWAITPWENHWIKIIGHSIVDKSGNINRSAWEIGSGYIADMQGYLGADRKETTVFYPAGYVWMYPPRGYLHGPGDPVKDVHGSCTGGGTATVQVTFYYVSAEGLVPPAPPPPLCTTYATLNPADKAPGIALSNGNLTATSNGANSHQMVRATTGIAPNTYRVHYEFTISGMGGAGTPINVFGLQDASAPTNTQLGYTGTSFGVGYNAGNGYTYAANFSPAGGPSFPMPNGTYAVDYDSFSGVASITGPGIIFYTSRTMTTTATLFPGYSAYGSTSGSVTFNFGASTFYYGTPAGYQSGLCQ